MVAVDAYDMQPTSGIISTLPAADSFSVLGLTVGSWCSPYVVIECRYKCNTWEVPIPTVS
jgi:hypothetical protein